MLIEYTQNRLSSGIDNGCRLGELGVAHSPTPLTKTRDSAAGADSMSLELANAAAGIKKAMMVSLTISSNVYFSRAAQLIYFNRENARRNK